MFPLTREELRQTAACAATFVLLTAVVVVNVSTGFVSSVLFSATRHARTHFGAFSVDAAPGLAAWRTIGVYTSCLFTFVVFADFNAVLYTHDPAWVVSFVPIAALAGQRDDVP